MATMLEVIQRVRRGGGEASDWLWIADQAVDLGLFSEAELTPADFDEDKDEEIVPPGFAERGLWSTIGRDILLDCIRWADRLSGSGDDAAALEVVRYYLRFDAWPETLNAPDPPSWEETRRQVDHEFAAGLGPESPAKKCRRDGCERGVVESSVLCRRHHFESVRSRPYPFDD